MTNNTYVEFEIASLFSKNGIWMVMYIFDALLTKTRAVEWGGANNASHALIDRRIWWKVHFPRQLFMLLKKTYNFPECVCVLLSPCTVILKERAHCVWPPACFHKLWRAQILVDKWAFVKRIRIFFVSMKNGLKNAPCIRSPDYSKGDLHCVFYFSRCLNIYFNLVRTC